MYYILVTKKRYYKHRLSESLVSSKFCPIRISCRLNAVFLTNHSPRIICTSIIGNLSVQVGVPPGVGSIYGYFEVLGVGSESA